MKNYLVVGSPGSGKSTQARLLAEKLGLPHFASGEVFRQIAQQETPLGHQIKKAMTEGSTLVDNDTAVEVFTQFLSKQEIGDGFVLDGFPRNVYQAEKFAMPIHTVIHLKLPDEVAKQRLLDRSNLEDRPDDKLEVINRRFEAYHKVTEPLVTYFAEEGKIIQIDARPDIKTIHQNILDEVVE